MNLKFLVALNFCLLLFFAGRSQQITLRGQVSIHNSQFRTGQIEYVKNAFVSAPFTTPDDTDDLGLFHLEFVGLDAGTSVKLDLEKVGLEVINQRDLQDVIIGRKNPLKVFMAPKGELAKAQTELYQVSINALTASHDQMILRLRQEGDESKAALAEVAQKLKRSVADRFEAEKLLQEQLETIKKQLPEFAQELSIVNLDFATEMYQKAYTFFKVGEIEKAISILDETQLDLDAAVALENITQIDKDITSLEAAKINEQERLDQLIESYQLKATSFRLLFQFRKAINVYKKVIVLLEKSQPEGIALPRAHREIAILYRDLVDFPLALEHELEDVRICDALLDADDPELARAYNALALIYRDLGQYSQALQTQQKAINILEQSHETMHPDWLSFYNNLGLIYQDLGQLNAALEMHQKVVVLREKTLNPDHMDLANSYNNLCITFLELGQYEASLDAAKKVVAIREKHLEANHPSLAKAYINLASNYLYLKQYDQAIQKLQKAIDIQTNVLETNHPDLAFAYNNLASVYMNMGQYSEALENQEKALQIRMQVLSPNHPDIATTYNNLSTIYFYLKKYDEAIDAQQKALDIRSTALPPEHPDFAESFHNLATVFYQKGALDQAILNEAKAYAILQKNLPAGHPNLKTTEANFAIWYKDRGKLFQSEEEYLKAIADYYKALEFDIGNNELLQRIGYCLYQNKDYKASIQFYEQNFSQDTSRLGRATYLNYSGLAYAKSGKFKKAKERFETLQKLTPDNSFVYRNWAVYYALKKDIDLALEQLEKAVDLGYNKKKWIEEEDGFEVIRKQERYQQIIKKL
ncbi:MAG: hypothetical protein DHS20C18_07900 [Saprospiraceae bacterium]|nr:MAG: hypothetical protein DHS20C18_07900 [Saprospiraceae bacterium]